jgi:hypothetical protein
MSLFRTSRSTRARTADTPRRTRLAVSRAMAAAPTEATRHELIAMASRL